MVPKAVSVPFTCAIACALLSGSTLLLAACDARPQVPKAVVPAVAEDQGLRMKAIGSYILVQSEGDNRTFVTTEGAHIKSIPALKARFGNTFLWFRFEKKDYVIQDPATLVKARELFKEDAELEAQEAALETQEAELDHQHEAIDARRDVLDEQRDRLGAQEEDQAEDAQGSASAHTGLDAERRKLDKEMQALDKELQTLDQELEKLSQQLEAVSAKQEKVMNAAEHQLQQMMMDTVKSGIALPVADKIK
jgi:predicted phage tail protein